MCSSITTSQVNSMKSQGFPSILSFESPCDEGQANLKNIFVSPYPTLFYRYGSVSRTINIFTSQIGYLYTVNPVLGGHSKKTKMFFFQDWLSHNAGQKYCRMLPAHNAGQKFCRMLPGEHSANTFDLHLASICLNNHCCAYLWVAVLDMFYCIVLLIVL